MQVETAAREAPGAASPTDSFDSYNEQGIAHFKENRFAEAAVWFRKAVAIRRELSALHNLGTALAKREKLDEAVAVLREALQLNPKALTSHKNLGLALHQQGKPGAAAVHY